MSSPSRPRRRAAFKGNYGDLEKTNGIDGSGSEPEVESDVEDDDVVAEEAPQTPRKRRPPVKRTNTDLDRSARKRAAKVIFQKQFENEEADTFDADKLLAERVIADEDVPNPLTMSPIRKLLATANTDFSEEDGSQSLFLDGSEGYFDQHKVREKISTTPFSKAPNIEYQDYSKWVQANKSRNKDGIDFLKSMYKKTYSQWYFELTQGFGLVFYGIGSKRDLLMDFVQEKIPNEMPVFVANGYNPATQFKEILLGCVNILVKTEEIRAAMPRHPPDMLTALLNYLEDQPDTPLMVLLIHNIDGESIRSDRSQAILSRLCSAKQIWTVCSVDHIQAPIMWDAAKLAQFRFIWHDVTTYESYIVESSFDDPLALGKNRSAVAGKGIKFVLKSLTANARSLYKQLICHQIDRMTELLPQSDTATVGSTTYGIEFKSFYRKCVEELIVSNELNFRTMLSEFIDHKMAVNTKNLSGVETVYAPFTRDACETILDELMEME